MLQIYHCYLYKFILVGSKPIASIDFKNIEKWEKSKLSVWCNNCLLSMYIPEKYFRNSHFL